MPYGHDGATKQGAYRVGYSDATSIRHKRRDMVLCKRRWTVPYRVNLFQNSSYDNNFWTVFYEMTDLGNITVGPYSDDNTVSHSMQPDGSDLSIQNGLPTWNGDYPFILSSPMDISSYNTLVFSLEFCAYQSRGPSAYEIHIGTCDTTALEWSNSQHWAIWNLIGNNRVWCKVPVSEVTADIHNTCFYMTVFTTPNTGAWSFTNAQLEPNVSSPGIFIATSGAAINPDPATFTGQSRGMGKIHPSEWELVQEDWEGIVTPREGQDQASFVTPVEDV